MTMRSRSLVSRLLSGTIGIFCALFAWTTVHADPISLGWANGYVDPSATTISRDAEAIDDAQLDPSLQRRIVSYPSEQLPGTVIIDTPNTYLYFVLGGGKAIRYGIGVGREGFAWSGVKTVERKSEWPDWTPPAEMIQRQPYLPRFVAGGPSNPLGARAIYLGGSLYRIHGTNAPSTIGKRVSSGCIRLRNEDVMDLYERVKLGAKVIVLPVEPRRGPDLISMRGTGGHRVLAGYVGSPAASRL